MKKIMPILVALMIAALASWGIVNYTKKWSTQGNQKRFVAARVTLQPGHVIKEVDIKEDVIAYPAPNETSKAVWRFVTGDFVPPERDSQVIGRTVSKEIQEGHPILATSLQSAERVHQRMDWKASKIPDGKRAIAIPVDNDQAVNGLVEVGDHVDVLVTIMIAKVGEDDELETITIPLRMGDISQDVKIPTGGSRKKGEAMSAYLFQDVEILAVGTKTFQLSEIDEEDPLQALAAQQTRGSGVTIALDPQDALLLSFVISAGDADFTLVLRTPGDQTLYNTASDPTAGLKDLLLKLGVSR